MPSPLMERGNLGGVFCLKKMRCQSGMIYFMFLTSPNLPRIVFLGICRCFYVPGWVLALSLHRGVVSGAVSSGFLLAWTHSQGSHTPPFSLSLSSPPACLQDGISLMCIHLLWQSSSLLGQDINPCSALSLVFHHASPSGMECKLKYFVQH